MTLPVGTENPRITCMRIASISIACAMAWRTLTSLNGFLPLTLLYASSSRPWSMPRKMTRFSGPSMIFTRGSRFRRGMSCSGGSRTKEISPVINADMRVASDLIGR